MNRRPRTPGPGWAARRRDRAARRRRGPRRRRGLDQHPQRTADGTVNGVLTVQPFGNAPAVVDPKSLVFAVNGKDYPVTAQQGSDVQRSTILLIDRSGSMRDTGMATVRSSVAPVPPERPQGRQGRGHLLRRPSEPRCCTDHRPQRDPVGRRRPDVRRGHGALRRPQPRDRHAGHGRRAQHRDAQRRQGHHQHDQGSAGRAEAQGRPASAAQVIAFNTSYTDNLALEFLAAAGQGVVREVGNSAGVADAFTSAARALSSQVSWSAAPAGCPRATGRRRCGGPPTASRSPPWPRSTSVRRPCRRSPTSTATTPAPTGSAAGPAGRDGAAPRHVAHGVPLRASGARPAGSRRPSRPCSLFVGLLLLASAADVTGLQVQAPRAGRVHRSVRRSARPHGSSRPSGPPISAASPSTWSSSGDRVVEGRESTPARPSCCSERTCRGEPGSGRCCESSPSSSACCSASLLIHGDGLLPLFGALLGIAVGDHRASIRPPVPREPPRPQVRTTAPRRPDPRRQQPVDRVLPATGS